MKTITILIFAFFCIRNSYSQDVFNAVYPIGENPNIGYKTSMVPSIEKILFEANPNLRMPFYNNIRRKLMTGNHYNSGSTLYLNFRPQLRMYTDNSLPVKTPSYKISILGYQKLIRLKPGNFFKNHMLAFSIESGHYSNGQSKCAFNKDIDDGTAACDSVYKLITPASNLSTILNRESCNFSTNYTELILNYRIISALDEDNKPASGFSLKLGWNRYHDKLLFLADIGGYSDDDIKIYGKNRYLFGVEYFTTFSEHNWLRQKLGFNRISFSSNFEYISKPHPYVKPSRLDVCSTVYFNNNLGIFISGIFGHDNYNFRFVDSGSQLFAGITFDIFPPIEIK
jgi:hypothetical protein